MQATEIERRFAASKTVEKSAKYNFDRSEIKIPLNDSVGYSAREFVAVKNTQHFVMLDQPEAVNRLLTDFFGGRS